MSRSRRGGFAQATNLVSELVAAQLTAVFAENQAKSVSVTTLSNAHCLLGDLRSTVTLASRVLRDSLFHDRDAFVYHTSEFVSPLCVDHLVSGPSLCLQRDMFTESKPMRSLS